MRRLPDRFGRLDYAGRPNTTRSRETVSWEHDSPPRPRVGPSAGEDPAGSFDWPGTMSGILDGEPGAGTEPYKAGATGVSAEQPGRAGGHTLPSPTPKGAFP